MARDFERMTIDLIRSSNDISLLMEIIRSDDAPDNFKAHAITNLAYAGHGTEVLSIAEDQNIPKSTRNYAKLWLLNYTEWWLPKLKGRPEKLARFLDSTLLSKKKKLEFIKYLVEKSDLKCLVQTVENTDSMRAELLKAVREVCIKLMNSWHHNNMEDVMEGIIANKKFPDNIKLMLVRRGKLENLHQHIGKSPDEVSEAVQLRILTKLSEEKGPHHRYALAEKLRNAVRANLTAGTTPTQAVQEKLDAFFRGAFRRAEQPRWGATKRPVPGKRRRRKAAVGG